MNNSATAKQTVNDLVQDGKELINRASDKIHEMRPINERLEQGSVAVKEAVATNLHSAAEKVHEKSDSAQDALNGGADRLHEYAQSTIGKVNAFGHRTGDALERGSEYVQNFDISEATQQVRDAIVRKPAVSIGIAAAVGIIFGLALGRRLR